MPKGNDSTTHLHVKLARLDPASIATLLMAMLFVQPLFNSRRHLFQRQQAIEIHFNLNNDFYANNL